MSKITAYTILIEHKSDAPDTQAIANHVATLPKLTGTVHVMNDMTIGNKTDISIDMEK